MSEPAPEPARRGRLLAQQLARPPRAGILVALAALAAALAGCAATASSHNASASPAASASALARAAAPAPGASCTGTPPAAVATAPRAAPNPAPTATASNTNTTLIRINQLGYVAPCPKNADVMATSNHRGAAFTVTDRRTGRRILSGRLARSRGAFNRHWRFVYQVDLTGLRRPGTYVLRSAGATSPQITVASGAAPYRPLTRDLLTFFQQQRDGPDVIPGPLNRQPSHLLDERASVYATPTYQGTTLTSALTPTGTQLNASGGWFDAGDYLKFVETASFDDVMMLFTLRQYRAGIADPAALAAEARFGTDWLLRMWDQDRRVLYYQVGIGDGNGSTVLGDHDLWRLPQADDHRRVSPGSPAYYETYRPVFAANAPGSPLSPNLAGRVAAAFALCAQDFAATDPAYARRCLVAGQTIYDLADTHWTGNLVTTTPFVYYGEPEWRDDMALGGAELYLATRQLGGAGLPHPTPYGYAVSAGQWADAYITSPLSQGDVLSDSLNLYDVSSLADYDLVRILRSPEYTSQQTPEHDARSIPTDPASLLSDRHDQLAQATKLSARDPFGLANPATNVDTVPHALGYAVQAHMYDELAGKPTFVALTHKELDWVFGANPWGSSFIVGAGRVYPHCLAAQIPNLSGSLTGRGAILRGATVDGPNSLDSLHDLGAPDGYRPCPAGGRDPFRSLTGRSTGYLDDVTSSSTSEPSGDYAALALMAAAQQAAQ